MKPRGLRNNNPGNIRRSDTLYVGEKESTDPEFKQFTSMAYGYRAMFMLLYTYQVRYGLNTLQSMIARYAPESENNTANYIRQVSSWSGIDPNSRLTTTNRDTMIPLVSAMSRFENGLPTAGQEVEQGWGLFIADIQK